MKSDWQLDEGGGSRCWVLLSTTYLADLRKQQQNQIKRSPPPSSSRYQSYRPEVEVNPVTNADIVWLWLWCCFGQLKSLKEVKWNLVLSRLVISAKVFKYF